MSKQAVIFDLDNCLSPANAVGESLFAPAFEAIRRAGDGAFSEERLASAFADCWIHPYDWVAAHHGFSAAMRTAGWDVLRGLEVQGTMRGYDDLSTLERLASRRFLVTSGFRRLQASKIRALAIAPLFEAVHIDAIDEAERWGKQALFEQILNDARLPSDQVLVVGDNPESEIAAGNRLGLHTVQILRPGVIRSDAAVSHVRSLAGLRELLQ